MSNEEQDEVRSHRRKRKAGSDDNMKNTKIGALEAQIKEQSQLIASLRTNGGNDTKGLNLPPEPKGNMLKSPKGFTQRE